MALRSFGPGTVVKLVLICLAVGFAVSAMGIQPSDFWVWARDAAAWVARQAVAVFHWGADYVLIGAAIVVPIVVIRYGWRWLRGR